MRWEEGFRSIGEDRNKCQEMHSCIIYIYIYAAYISIYIRHYGYNIYTHLYTLECSWKIVGWSGTCCLGVWFGRVNVCVFSYVLVMPSLGMVLPTWLNLFGDKHAYLGVYIHERCLPTHDQRQTSPSSALRHHPPPQKRGPKSCVISSLCLGAPWFLQLAETSTS